MGLQMAENQGFSAPPPQSLSLKPIPDAEGTLAKRDFGRFIGVSAPRVTQYLKEGKLSGPAITEKGRIHVETALAQLRRRLDPIQMTGNGLDTNLKPASTQSAAPETPALPLPPPVDSTEEQIKRARLAGIEYDNRKKAEDEAARAGRYALAEDVTQQLGRVAGGMLTTFDGMIAEMATAVAANFKLPQRDVLHLMRGEFRKSRAAAAAAAKQNAAALPPLVEQKLDSGDEATEQTNSEPATEALAQAE